MGFAFLIGLGGDLLIGQVLGEQALRLVVLVFIVLRFRSRLRFFPIGQQSLAVLALLLNDRMVVMMIRALGSSSCFFRTRVDVFELAAPFWNRSYSAMVW